MVYIAVYGVCGDMLHAIMHIYKTRI